MIRFKLDDNFTIEVSPEIVSKRLKSVIEEKGISYTELKDLTGIPRATIQRYAAGKTDKIPTDRLVKIALKTHTSIFYLLGQDVPMEEEPMRAVQRPLSIVFPDGTSCAPDLILEHIRDTDEKSKLVTDVLLKVPKLSMEDLRKVNDYIDLLLLRHDKET